MSGERVVVLRPLGLGDLCCAVPALRAVRSAFPDHLVQLAAPAWQSALALGAGVDEVVAAEPLASLDRRLHRADVAVNLHGRGPESTALLAATSPRRLIAFDHPARARRPTVAVTWRAGEHEVTRWCRLLTESGIPADPADLHLPRPVTAADRFDHPTAVVHPGAAAPARRWPIDRFGAVVRHLASIGLDVVVTGGPAERSRAGAVAAAGAGCAGRVGDLSGATDLADLAAVVAAARLVVAGDTGVAHLATAYRTPSVVLFGPVPPSEWGPPPDGRHVALWSGRRGDPHGCRLDRGLDLIDVADVTAATDELVSRVVL